MKRAIFCLLMLSALFFCASCGGGDGKESGGDADVDADKDKDHIYIPPDGDSDSGNDSDISEVDIESAELESDFEYDSIEYFENVGEDEEEIYECDPYTAIDTCLTVNYDKDTRRYCEAPGNWVEESCAPGACVTDGASAWCVGKEDSSDGDEESGELEEAEDDGPLTVTHQCTPQMTMEGLPCENDYACPTLCGFTIYCYACSIEGVCSVTEAGAGSCADPADGDEELDGMESEPEAEPESEPEPEPEAEPDGNECDGSSLWYCVENVLHYCDANHWGQADCAPGVCVDPEEGNAYCQ